MVRSTLMPVRARGVPGHRGGAHRLAHRVRWTMNVSRSSSGTVTRDDDDGRQSMVTGPIRRARRQG